MNEDKYAIDLVKLALSAYFSDYALKDQPTRQILLRLIKAITIGGRFNKIHFELLYGYIAKNPHDLLGSLELIEHIICVDTSHIPMFYFSDIESYIEINPILTTEKAFTTAFGIGIWFRLEEFNKHPSEGEGISTLFSIYSNTHGGFEAYFEGDTLYYGTLGPKKLKGGPEEIDDENKTKVFTFETQRWYTLYIMHVKKYLGSSEVRFFVDKEFIKEANIEYPKMDKVGKLDRGYICKNFTGQVSSVLILNEHITSKTAMEIFERFPKVINAEKFLDECDNNPRLKEDKVRDKLFSLFVPSRTHKMGNSDDIYVDFSSITNKGKLGPLAGVFSQETQKNQFLFCGELKALLPVMTLFKNIQDIELGRKIFQKFLDII